MTIRVQPDEAIHLTINSLAPTLEVKTEAINLDLSYRGRQLPEAYEALLLDALRGDFSRNVRADEVDATWKIFTPLLRYLEDEAVVPREYAYGMCLAVLRRVSRVLMCIFQVRLVRRGWMSSLRDINIERLLSYKGLSLRKGIYFVVVAAI